MTNFFLDPLRSVQQFESSRIAVIGDLMLDVWLEGPVRRISQEAPIPVVELTSREVSPGGAANVAELLTNLGATVSLLGVVGDDDEALALKEAVSSTSVTVEFVHDADRPTTTKTRILSGTQQICRLDVEDRRPVSRDVESRLTAAIPDILHGADAIIISDYGKGALTAEVVEAVFGTAFPQAERPPVIVDPQGSDVARYARATLLKPNRLEAFSALQVSFDETTPALELAEALRERIGGCAVLVTDGANGMALAAEDETGVISPIGRAVADTAGAGDAVTAVSALALASGFGLTAAAHWGNVAGAAAVSKRGTEPISISELLAVAEEQ